MNEAESNTPEPANSAAEVRASGSVWTFTRSRFLPIAALVLLSAVPYLNTLRNGFVYDDTTQVLNNPYVRSFHHVREIFTTTVWSYRGGAEATATAYYRPMMMLLFLLCFQFFGPAAAFFHLANILFNAAVVIAVFLVTERMFENRSLAFAAAAIFALHPIHSEAVAWIAAVTDLQLCLFYLLTFWFFLGLPRHGFTNRANWALWAHWGRPLLSGAALCACFILALLSKESAVTLPLLATIYEHFYRQDRLQTHWIQKLSRYGALWVLEVAYFLFRFRVLGPIKATRIIPPEWVLLSSVGLVGQYLTKFLWPVRLCAFYVFPDNLFALVGRVPLGLTALLAVGLAFWALRRRAYPVSFGIVWCIVALMPVLNAAWMPANVFSERYLYVPSVGLCWVAAWGCLQLFEMVSAKPVWRRALAAGLAFLAALAVYRIVTRNRDWHDDVSFCLSTLAVSPDSVQIRNNLGQVYFGQGDYGGAEREWLKASKLAPDYPIILDNLGLVYTQERRYDEAIAMLLRSIRQAPGDLTAHINLGEAYCQVDRPQLAEEELQTAVRLAPFSVRARISLAELYFAQSKYQKAAEQFRRANESVPTSKAYLGEGLCYFQIGRVQDAENALKKAESISPADSHSHFTLGFFYAAIGRTEEAAKEYESGFKLDPGNAAARAAFEKMKAGEPQKH